MYYDQALYYSAEMCDYCGLTAPNVRAGMCLDCAREADAELREPDPSEIYDSALEMPSYSQ